MSRKSKSEPDINDYDDYEEYIDALMIPPKMACDRIIDVYPSFMIFYEQMYPLNMKIIEGVRKNKWTSNVIYRCIMRMFRKMKLINCIQILVIKEIAVEIYKDALLWIK
jgi:hypothetical protein